MKRYALLGLVAASGALWASPAWAATLQVGPGQKYTQIADALDHVKPGDVVEVQGGQTYTGTHIFRPEHGGTKDKPVTVRGILVDGKRPVLSGSGPGEWDTMIVLLNANHFVMEGFEVIGNGGTDQSGVVNQADDVTLRDFVIHDVRLWGALTGTDYGSGSLTVEYSEFYHNGDGEYSHQLYMATDEETYPGSVFRMRYCYVHDSLGGNSVQSRAQRNEIYFNWIEGAMYHELDLIGPDGADPDLAREDSDVVGNVFIKSSEYRVARIGGDGSGNSAGRYRFANNTMVLSETSTAAIGLQETVETLEMYNNVIYGPKPGFGVYYYNEIIGAPATQFGSNNWVLSGTTDIPDSWTGTITGKDPGWIDPDKRDFRLRETSPLIDKGTTETVSTGSLAFPKALLLPNYHPPQSRLLAIGTADGRNIVGAPDIGAFELNASAADEPPQDAPPDMTGPGGTGSGGSGSGNGSGNGNGNGNGVTDDGSVRSSCRYHVSPGPDAGGGWMTAGLASALLLARRRRRSR